MSRTTSPDAGTSVESTRGRERVTLEIATLVASERGCQPWDLEPLSRVTDPDAIEQLLESSSTDLEIGFDYEGGRVTVRSDGEVSYDHPATAV